MLCDRCKAEVDERDAVTRGGQTLCEDCLMDVMSPAKACDPWAVKLAKGAKDAGGAGELKGLEKAIFDLVCSRGRVPKEEVASLLGVRATEVDRAFSVLRHMELLRGDRRSDGGADLVPFSGG
ncbi:MAG: hypothetical protein HZB55_05550 [Deltaproteobacteria bacterium]|nr:hypothetical protein [Deltaproteobacteria bacterium]